MGKPAATGWIVLVLGIGLGLGLAGGYGWAQHQQRGDLAPAESAERARELLAIPDPHQRSTALLNLLSRSGTDALPALTEVYASAPLDRGDLELVHFARWWAGFDPRAALAWAKQDWRAKDSAVLAAIFRRWAHDDPKTAWGQAETLPVRGQRDYCVDAVITGWDESGQPGLVAFVQGLPKGWLRQRSAETLAQRRVVTLGPQRALEWARGLEPEDLRQLMAPRVASAATLTDPAAAAAWAEPLIAAAKRPTGYPRRIATRWILSDPPAAMAWLASLPAGADRTDGVTEAFRDWLSRDRFGAAQWLEANEMQPWNEPAHGLYARNTVAGTDPEQALAIVARFSDAEQRDYLTTVIARAWLERDWDAADAWIRQADLSDGVRKRSYMVSRPRDPRTPRGGQSASPGADRSPAPATGAGADAS